jgi:FkbM family methyltransferase
MLICEFSSRPTGRRRSAICAAFIGNLLNEARSCSMWVLPLTTHVRSEMSSSRPEWLASSDGHLERTETIDVPASTLDALTEKYGARDFIKIDVEGYER